MFTTILLTHNNALTIKKILNSVDWSDEIICVDDFSTDETVAIAKKMNAAVYQHSLENNFAEQRNFGLHKAKGDWILFLDSDEIVSPELRAEILLKISEVKNKNTDIHGYYLKRTDVFLGRELKYGETSQVKLLRLAKKGKGVWERPIHEIWNIKGLTETLDHPLLHYAHENVAQFISDINRYTTLNAAYLHRIGVRSDILQIVAYPKGKFLQNYFLRLGFLDGAQGFIMAMMMSFHSFLTRAKLYLLDHPGKS